MEQVVIETDGRVETDEKGREVAVIESQAEIVCDERGEE
jgi:hypothetical protein